MEPTFHPLDEIACATYLQLEGARVVLLQAHIETYEGIGIVRTISIPEGKVCIVTTTDMQHECATVLRSIRVDIPWNEFEAPAERDRLSLLGCGYSDLQK